jgi:hypothetical protein
MSLSREQRRSQERAQRRAVTKNNHNRRILPPAMDEWEQFDTIERTFQKIKHGEIEWDGTHYIIMGLKGEHYAVLPALEGWTEYWSEVAKRFNAEYDDGPLRRLAKSLEYDKPLTEQQVEAAYAVVKRQRELFRAFPRREIGKIAIEVMQRIQAEQEAKDVH